MKKEERVMEVTGDLRMEFEEVKKISEDSVGVPYTTWTRFCSAFMTIICC